MGSKSARFDDRRRFDDHRFEARRFDDRRFDDRRFHEGFIRFGDRDDRWFFFHHDRPFFIGERYWYDGFYWTWDGYRWRRWDGGVAIFLRF